MAPFCYETVPEPKKELLFRIYDKEDKGQIPLLAIRGILSDELFVRSHYSEVAPGLQVRSVYGEQVMKGIMEDVMRKYDKDLNRVIDYEEFKRMISDADVDLMFSLY